MKDFQWTTKKPKVEGWYWMKEKRYGCEEKPSIVYVRDYVGRMCIVNWEIPDGAWWAGPIPEPKGAFD